jgi:hypothetical protein
MKLDKKSIRFVDRYRNICVLRIQFVVCSFNKQIRNVK